MRPRHLVLALVGLAGLALGIVPALAANGSVTASGTSFSPQTVTVGVGEKVTWTNAGGSHNVHFDGETTATPASPDPPASWPADVSRTFGTAGTFTYYCDAHRAVGMTGTVVVTQPQTTSTTPPGTTSTQPPPPPPPPPPAAAPAPQVTVAVTRSSFCSRRTRTCRRPGIVIRTTTSDAVALQGSLTRRPLRGAGRARPAGTLRWRAAKGTSTTTFRKTTQRRAISPGRYRLTLRLADHPQVALPALTFTVR